MKLVEIKCKNCGNKLKIKPNQIDIDCEYCHAQYKFDDGVQHIKYDDMEQAGYEFEKGKIKARKEAKEQKEFEEQIKLEKIKKEEQKKKNLKWWIIGWIFMFPIPLTILIWKTNWNKNKKIICTVLLWIIILILGYTTPNEPTNNKNNNQNEVQKNETITKETKINNFINEYNKLADTKLIFIENFEVQDKQSNHYRTEFRLYAFKDSLGQSYILNDKTIDIIILNDLSIRIYSNNVTLEESIELIKYSSHLLDPNLQKEKINETINYIKEHKYANGYYYGNIGLLLNGYEEKGYEIMIKND